MACSQFISASAARSYDSIEPNGGKASNLKVLVVGGGVGGLAVGARLAKHGLDVTLLEKNDNVGGRLQSMNWTRADETFRFDTGPSLLLLPRHYRETFTALGEDISDYVTLKRVEPAAYRVFFAEKEEPGSLDLLYDVQEMCAQLEEVEEGSSSAFLRFLSNAKEALDKGTENFIAKDFRSFWDYANIFSLLPLLKRLSPFELLGQHHARMSSYFRKPKLRALFTFQDLYVGLTPYNAPGVFSLLAATELTDGVWYPVGGFCKIRDGLAAAATKVGVKIETNTSVKRINQMNGKIKSVTLADGTDLEADIVVSNVDLPYIYSDLLCNEGKVLELYLESRGTNCSCPGWPSKVRSNLIMRSKFSAGVIAFNWALSTRLHGISHHNVFLSDLYKRSWDRASNVGSLLQRPNFYVHAPSRTDPTASPCEADALTVLVPVANLGEGYAGGSPENDKKMVDAARVAVLETFKSAGFGDIEPLILHQTVYSPYDWRSMYNVKHGAAFGLSHNFFQLAYFRPDIADPYIRGLYFVGASTRPGNGIPLVLVGAKLTSRRIMEDYQIA